MGTDVGWVVGKRENKQGERKRFEDEYMRHPAFSVRFSVFERKRKRRSEEQVV